MLKSSKRIIMVMGLINYPEVEASQWGAIEQELDQIAG
jgi:hypothetical protein